MTNCLHRIGTNTGEKGCVWDLLTHPTMEHRPIISLDVADLARLRQDLLDLGHSRGRLISRRQAYVWDVDSFSVGCVEGAAMKRKTPSASSLAGETTAVWRQFGGLPWMRRPAHSELPSGTLVALTTGLNGDLPVRIANEPSQIRQKTKTRDKRVLTPPPPFPLSGSKVITTHPPQQSPPTATCSSTPGYFPATSPRTLNTLSTAFGMFAGPATKCWNDVCFSGVSGGIHSCLA